MLNWRFAICIHLLYRFSSVLKYDENKKLQEYAVAMFNWIKRTAWRDVSPPKNVSGGRPPKIPRRKKNRREKIEKMKENQENELKI